jgi:hypothetical protein
LFAACSDAMPIVRVARGRDEGLGVDPPERVDRHLDDRQAAPGEDSARPQDRRMLDGARDEAAPFTGSLAGGAEDREVDRLRGARREDDLVLATPSAAAVRSRASSSRARAARPEA